MTDPLSPSSSAPGAGSAGAPRGRAALWVSAFRPFYLLAAVYLVWVILTGAAAWSGFVRSGPGTLPLPGGVALWHGHEMLFGFAMAVVTGTVLTALPSWAGTPDVRDRQLALLAGLWFAGRLGFHVVGLWGPGIATLVAAIVDTALPLALLVLLTPQLTRCADRRYALLLPVLAVLAMANLVFHAAVAGLDAVGAATALRAALWALIVLYSLKGGVLTPTFTGNALVASGRGMAPTFRPALELAAVLTLVALGAADVGGAPPAVIALLGWAACIAQAWRVARWRGWRVLDEPLVTAMNLGFLWLLAALALRSAAAMGAPLPESAWMHAFTMGALGAMMLGLMTRVALRHTGRPLAAPRALGVWLALVSVAALARILAGTHHLGAGAIGLAALAWVGCFVAWLVCHAHMLLAPSLPRKGTGTPEPAP